MLFSLTFSFLCRISIAFLNSSNESYSFISYISNRIGFIMLRISGSIVSMQIFWAEMIPSWSLSSSEKSQVILLMYICSTILWED